MFVVSCEFLKKIVVDSVSRSKYSFVKDILQAYKDEYKFMAYEHKGYFSNIDTMSGYYEANMELLDTTRETACLLRQRRFILKSEIMDRLDSVWNQI